MLRRGEWEGVDRAYSREDEEEGAQPDSSHACSNLLTDNLVHFQVWINQGDVILLSLRDFQPDVADVIQKYTADEARSRE